MRKYPSPKKLRWKLFSIRLGVAIIFAGLVWIGVRGLLAQPISINKVQEVDPNAANQSQAQQQAAQRMNQAANEVEQAHNTRDRDQAVANLLVAGQTYQNVSTNQPGTENVTYEAAHQAAVNELASQTQTTGAPLITVNPDGSLGLTSAGLLVAAGVPTTAADLPQNPQTPPTGNGSSYRPTTKAECESGIGSWNEADGKCYLPGEKFPTPENGVTYVVCSGKEPGSKYPYPYRATSCPTAADTPTTPVTPLSQPVNNYSKCGSWGDAGCTSGTTCSYSPYGYYCVPNTVIQDSNTRNNIVESQGSKKCDGSTLKQLQGTSWVTLEICQYGCAGSKCNAPPPASKCGDGYTFNASTGQCTTNLSPDRIDDLRVKCEGTSTSRTGKYFDQATGKCVSSITEITHVNQCDESSNRAGANMWISCSADGRKTIKYCKSSRGFDALGVCQIDQPPTPTQTCAPKEERIGCNRNSCVGQTIKMTKADCKVSYRCESDASCVTTPTTPTTPTATPSLKVGDSCSTGFFWGLVGDTCKQCPNGISHLVGQRGTSVCGPEESATSSGFNTSPMNGNAGQSTCTRTCTGNTYCVPDNSGGHCVSDMTEINNDTQQNTLPQSNSGGATTNTPSHVNNQSTPRSQSAIADAALAKMQNCQPGAWGYYNACYGEYYHGQVLQPGDTIDPNFGTRPRDPEDIYWCTDLVFDSAEAAGINFQYEIPGAKNLYDDYTAKGAVTLAENVGSNGSAIEPGSVAFISKPDPKTGVYTVGHVAVVSDVQTVGGRTYVTVVQADAGTTTATYELDDKGRLTTEVNGTNYYIRGFGDSEVYAENQ